MKQKLPPLSYHALDLSDMFSDVQKMADIFAKGSIGFAAREQEALCASIISALFHWPDYLFSVNAHLELPDRCARFLYAALYAQRAVSPRPSALEYVNNLIKTLEPRLDDKEYDLFEGSIQTAHMRTEESLRSHLRTAMCVADVQKFVTGLFEKEPNWQEPSIPFWTLMRRRPERKRKKFSGTLAAFLGRAQ